MHAGMQKTIHRVVLAAAILQLTGKVLAASAKISSIYTPLAGKSCVLVKEDKETGNSLQSCPGVANGKVIVAYDDQRMSITLVLAEDKKEQPLDLWTVVTKSFSSLGASVEWRVMQDSKKSVPLALIVRVNATSSDGKKSSYLAIAKVSADQACVVDVISVASDRDANQRARRSADQSADKPCLRGEK